MNWNFDVEDSDGEDDLICNNILLATGNGLSTVIFGEDDIQQEKKTIDHRTLERGPRTIFEHGEALACINRDYLGSVPIFNDRQFELMCHISRSRFQKIMEDVRNADSCVNSFYMANYDRLRTRSSSMEAKLLLPLRNLAFGLPAHTFRDYFQMSETLARQACFEFDFIIDAIYKKEFLQKPDVSDLRAIVHLHKHVNKIPGKLGSMDCCHTVWEKLSYGLARVF